MRALRRRRGWRQLDVARTAGVSQAMIARIERGTSDRVSVRRLEQVAGSLGARVIVRLDFNGEAIDRLLDADHAGLVEAIIRRLGGVGWECLTEVTFSIDGERGSVDVLARHPETGAVLIVEAKTVVPDLQAMLATLDRKVRLGPRIARQAGWKCSFVGRLLVFADARTTRRRVAQHTVTFDAALPDRGAVVRQKLRAPDPREPLRGFVFLPGSHQATGRHRIQARPSRNRAQVPASRQPRTGG